MVVAPIRTFFARPGATSAHERRRRPADNFRRRFPKIAMLLYGGEDEVSAHLAFSRERWRQF